MIREISNFEDVQQIARDAEIPPVVYFTASWCAPCRAMKPEFAKAGVRDADRDYLILDIQTMNDQDVQKLGITSVPTILILNKPGNVTRIRGRKTEEILAEVAVS